MTPGAHNWTIARRTEKAFVSNPIRFRAECDCGWVCPEWRRSGDEAASDGYQHQAVAAPPDLDEAA